MKAKRKRKNKIKKETPSGYSQMSEDVLHTNTLNPSREEIEASLPHLKNKRIVDKEVLEEEEEMKLNSQIPELVKDVQFAVNNFGDISIEKANALDKLGRVVFKLGKYEELLELSYEIVAIKEQILGVDHIEVGGALRNVGTIAAKLKRKKDCEVVLLRALRIHRLNNFHEGSKEMAILQAKMYQCGIGNDLIASDGIAYEEYVKLGSEDTEL